MEQRPCHGCTRCFCGVIYGACLPGDATKWGGAPRTWVFAQPPGDGHNEAVGDSGEPRYRPLREIARGGMGRVVEAVDRELGRTVALKENIADHPEARRRFAREVAITARLEHPSIVPLYDAGVSA